MAEGDFDILVIENEVDLRDVLARILTHEGYAVRTAVNGAEALAILASPSRPRLIVLDLMMPVVNGVAFLDLRQQDAVAREIPVIVLTGSVRPGLFERPDVAAVLSKPPSLKTFLATVRALCPLASEPPPSGAQMLN